MKIPAHTNCPQEFNTGLTYRSATAVTLHQRDPTTRQMKKVGVRCRRCGAVKMDNWPAWVKAT